MTKVVVLLTRQSGMDRDAFREHWRTAHAAIALKLPGLRRYVQNHAVPDPALGEPSHDGLAEMWFDSNESTQAAMMSPAGQALSADMAQFVDLTKVNILVVDELTLA
jgi:uncharacterized protein (TIGR02118 family)